MYFSKLNSMVTRLLFLAAFVVFGIAVIERVLGLFGYTILGELYAPGRLVEFSTVLLIFVIALLLRQVREELKKRNGSG